MNSNKFYMFVADWCPYCRAVKPVVFDLMDKYFDNKNIFIIEDSSEEYKTLGLKLNATSLPTFIIANENDEEVLKFDESKERSFENLQEFYITNTDSATKE